MKWWLLFAGACFLALCFVVFAIRECLKVREPFDVFPDDDDE